MDADAIPCYTEQCDTLLCTMNKCFLGLLGFDWEGRKTEDGEWEREKVGVSLLSYYFSLSANRRQISVLIFFLSQSFSLSLQ